MGKFIHGHWRGGASPTYRIYQGMKTRCHNPKAKDYPRYGGRGITVCDRWRESFQNFLDDMGEVPEGNYSIDRVDGSKGYSAENCRWATFYEQHHNKRGIKLNEGIVRRIRNLCAAGFKQNNVARTYGIGPMQVSRIVRGLRWTDSFIPSIESER